MHPRPYLALVAVQVAFATHKLFAKLVLDERVPPATVAGLRVLFSALLLCVLAFPRAPVRWERHDVWRFLGLGFVGAAANQLLFAEGLARTTVIDTALLMTLTPVFALLLAVSLRIERFDALRAGGVLVGLAGALVLLRVEEFGGDRTHLLGNLLIVLNTLTYAVYMIASRGMLQRLPTTFVAAGTFAAGSLFVTPLAMPGLVGLSVAGGVGALALWGFVGVVGTTMMAYVLNGHALKHLAPGTVAVFIFLQPILATALAVWLRGEPLTARSGLAGILILVGVGMVVRRAVALQKPTAVTTVRAEAES